MGVATGNSVLHTHIVYRADQKSYELFIIGLQILCKKVKSMFIGLKLHLPDHDCRRMLEGENIKFSVPGPIAHKCNGLWTVMDLYKCSRLVPLWTLSRDLCILQTGLQNVKCFHILGSRSHMNVKLWPLTAIIISKWLRQFISNSCDNSIFYGVFRHFNFNFMVFYFYMFHWHI